jgi:signal transduction histidine kinase
MTTSGTFPPAGRWWRANRIAFLLPVAAADTLGLLGGATPWLLLTLAVAIALLAPKESAKIVPFAFLAYGAYGFFLVHALAQWNSLAVVVYGVTRVGPADNVAWVIPQAAAFLAAGVWLLARTDAPGGRAVRRAAEQLRGTTGQPRTVPPLLVLPMIFLWQELYSDGFWFSGNPAHCAAAALTAAACLAAAVFLPRVAATAAVAGIMLFGLGGIVVAAHWILTRQGMPAGVGSIALYGAVPVVNGGTKLLAGAEGLVLLGGCCLLVPRMLSWGTDTELARRAQALAQRVDRLTRTRTDATEVAVAELRRIERDLHDGAQARLVAVGMSLRAAEELMGANPEAARALVAEARETSSRALDDLRGLVRGIYPPVLADRGLADAVRALALDAPVAVDTDITLEEEPPMPVAAAVYFAIAEALTNAVRHSGADAVEIGIGHSDGGMLRATIVDDGQGGADASAGTGLSGIERRLATFDGVVAVTSPPGGPTIVVIEVPCPLTAAAGWPGDASRADVVRSSWRTGTLI